MGSAGWLDGLGHQMRRPAADGRQYGTGGPVVMGRAACTGRRHAARVRHDRRPVAHGQHHSAARGSRRRREHQRIAAADAAGHAARRRRDGRLHQAAGGHRGRRFRVQEVAPGLRRRRRIAGVLVRRLVLLVLRYAPGQDLRQQLQLRHTDTSHVINVIPPRTTHSRRTGQIRISHFLTCTPSCF